MLQFIIVLCLLGSLLFHCPHQLAKRTVEYPDAVFDKEPLANIPSLRLHVLQTAADRAANGNVPSGVQVVTDDIDPARQDDAGKARVAHDRPAVPAHEAVVFRHVDSFEAHRASRIGGEEI